MYAFKISNSYNIYIYIKTFLASRYYYFCSAGQLNKRKHFLTQTTLVKCSVEQ